VIVSAGGNLPCVSPRISDHRSAVTIGHVGRYFEGGRIRRYRCAPKTVFKNVIKFSGSRTMIRGVRVCHPSG
jgi:hypothetical protein